MDWLFCGAVTPALAAYRKDNQSTRPFVEAVRKLDDAEQRMFLMAIRASQDLSADLDQILETLKTAVTEYHASQPG